MSFGKEELFYLFVEYWFMELVAASLESVDRF